MGELRRGVCSKGHKCNPAAASQAAGVRDGASPLQHHKANKVSKLASQNMRSIKSHQSDSTPETSRSCVGSQLRTTTLCQLLKQAPNRLKQEAVKVPGERSGNHGHTKSKPCKGSGKRGRNRIN